VPQNDINLPFCSPYASPNFHLAKHFKIKVASDFRYNSFNFLSASNGCCTTRHINLFSFI